MRLQFAATLLLREVIVKINSADDLCAIDGGGLPVEPATNIILRSGITAVLITDVEIDHPPISHNEISISIHNRITTKHGRGMWKVSKLGQRLKGMLQI